MIDFNSNGLFARLKKVDPGTFGKVINDFLIEDENVIGAYQSVRDGLVFTNKRIIAINVQGITGKKQDYTSIPYNKISTFSLETAGLLDLDAEMEIYMSGVGKVKFQFTQSTDVKEICKAISRFILGEATRPYVYMPSQPTSPPPASSRPTSSQPTPPRPTASQSASPRPAASQSTPPPSVRSQPISSRPTPSQPTPVPPSTLRNVELKTDALYADIDTALANAIDFVNETYNARLTYTDSLSDIQEKISNIADTYHSAQKFKKRIADAETFDEVVSLLKMHCIIHS